MLCFFTKQVLAQLDSLDVNMSIALLECMDGSRWQPLKPVCSSRHFGFPSQFPTYNFQHLHSGPLAEEHSARWIYQAILAISLDLAGSESFVRRCRVVKQHDMFQENFDHVPRILFARSCVRTLLTC